MKKIINIFTSYFHVFATLILIFIGAGFSQGVQDFEEITVKGKIYAFNWDEDSVVTSAVLCVDKKDFYKIPYIEEYFIHDDEMGQQLFELIGDSVEVTGVIDPKDLFKRIHVKKYRIIKEEN